MSENDVPYSSGCFAAGLFLFVHFVLLIMFINLHIGLLFPVFLIVEFIAQIIATLILGCRISWLKENSEKERIEGLAAVAKDMNFSFAAEGALEAFGRLRHYSRLLSQDGGFRQSKKVQQSNTWKVSNVMQGNIHNADVTIMDYELYTTSRGLFIPGYGKWVEDRAGIFAKTALLFRLHTLTAGTITPGEGDYAVIIFRSPALRLPRFTLHPEAAHRKVDALRKLDEALEHRDIDFGSHPTFSRQYFLKGSDEEGIRGLFNTDILSYYERHLGLDTEGVGEQLLVYKPSERLSPENIPSFIKQGLKVFELFQAAQRKWNDVLQRLEEKTQHPGSLAPLPGSLAPLPGSLAPLIADLTNKDWREQFIARYTLAALGGEVVEPLMAALDQDSDVLFKDNAVWVLKRIAEETTGRLATNASDQVCSRCLVRYHAHQINLSWWQKTFTYYGCRACRQSREFFSWPDKIVAVLDQEMNAEQVQSEGVLRVNWLARQTLFDFDEVEIVRATDEDVERLVCLVINDTDEFRRPRYKGMSYKIAQGCRLLENSQRILKTTFE